jgi:hypothetical protein
VGRKRRRPPPLTAAGYLEAVARLAQAAELPAGSVALVEVQHQDGCDLLARRGPCNCSPAVSWAARTDSTPELRQAHQPKEHTR